MRRIEVPQIKPNVAFFTALANGGYSLVPLKVGQKGPPVMRGWSGLPATPAHELAKILKRFPYCNIGVVTTGLYIVDVDNPEAEWWLKHRQEVYKMNPPPMLVKSVKRINVSKTDKPDIRACGHVYFRAERDYEQVCIENILDVKCCGRSYVQAPGSVADGRHYWTKRVIPLADLPVVPDHMVIPNTKRKSFGGKITNVRSPILDEDNKKFGEGGRNHNMARVIGWIVRKASEEDHDLAHALAQGANLYMCDPPLSYDEVKEIFISISNAERRRRAEEVADNLGLTSLNK